MVTPIQTYMVEDDSLPDHTVNENGGGGGVSTSPTPWWVWVLVALVGYQALSNGRSDDA